MAGETSTRQAGGVLGGVVSLALVVFVCIVGSAAYYATRPVAVPLSLLRAELTRLEGRVSTEVMRDIKRQVIRQSAALLGPRGNGSSFAAAPRVADGPDWTEQFEKLAVIIPLLVLRVCVLALALPLWAVAALGAIFEGLWAREGIAATSGFSSAAGFAVGKTLLALSGLAILSYLFVPIALPLASLVPALAIGLGLGSYLVSRNLPLFF